MLRDVAKLKQMLRQIENGLHVAETEKNVLVKLKRDRTHHWTVEDQERWTQCTRAIPPATDTITRLLSLIQAAESGEEILHKNER